MPPELRKRKAAAEPATAPPAKKKSPIAKAVAKVKEAVAPEAKATKAATQAATQAATKAATKATTASATPGKIAVGETIDLEGFGGEIETNDGVKTTLKKLVDESKSGVIVFTYPKASTPGCITQACLFRDSYTPFTATGFDVYGLSKDSPKANTTFKTKQKLPYPLLCDTSASLIGAIGLKKAPSGTTRGVFVVDKSGKILAVSPGGPAATHEIVKSLIDTTKTTSNSGEETKAEVNGVNGVTKEDIAKADVAGEVVDTAEKLDASEAKADSS